MTAQLLNTPYISYKKLMEKYLLCTNSYHEIKVKCTAILKHIPLFYKRLFMLHE